MTSGLPSVVKPAYRSPMPRRPSLPALFVLAASALALGAAFIAQYGYGLRPCNLCLAQRVPFVIAGLAALAALRLPEGVRPLALLLAGVAFLANAGIAGYHVGVEQHWWASAVCSGDPTGPLSVADLMAEMTRPVEVRCDQPQWAWHGITMAALNIVYSGGLALVTLVLARRRSH
jgi:disulfide bond formation protein DsbB